MLVRIQKKNLGMLDVPKERQKGDGRWMRVVSWITSLIENICYQADPVVPAVKTLPFNCREHGLGN